MGDRWYVAQCDTCHDVRRFDTPVERSRWATDHFDSARHRPHAWDEMKSGLLVPPAER